FVARLSSGSSNEELANKKRNVDLPNSSLRPITSPPVSHLPVSLSKPMTTAGKPIPYSRFPLLVMALTKVQKSAQLIELKEKFDAASSVIFAHYIGLKVSDVSDLRKKLKVAGAEM